MGFNIISEFKKKSKSFKITAVIAAVVIIVLLIILYILNPNIPAESISLEDTNIYLEKNMIYTLNPEIEPYNTTKKNLVYKCSDNGVVRLDGNKIIPIGNGKASVYCYDKKSNTKSNVITVNVVNSIEKLIPQEYKEDEELVIENSADAAKYVYYTDNGTKYHTKDCSYLGKNPRKGILYNVQASERKPCARCNP